MHEYDVTAADGARLRAWRTDGQGPPVLLCPRLDTAAASTDATLISWCPRGDSIDLADQVADAVAVLDAAGVSRCVVMAWSSGVAVAAELARRHPARVSGLLLAAGAPGDPFAAMPALPFVPAALRRAVALGGAHAVRAAGPLVDAVLHRLPGSAVSTTVATLLTRTGLVWPGAKPADLVDTMRRLLRRDWRSYLALALAMGSLPRQDLGGVTCPVTVLAGRYDLLTDPASVTGPVSALPQARVRVLSATHFLPLEVPEVLDKELRLLLDRVEAVERARAQLEPPLTRGSRRPA